MAIPTKTMSQLIEELAEVSGFAKSDVKGFIAAIEGNLYDTVKDGMVFKFGNSFRVKIVPRKARMGRNPATGETIKIPASKRLKFTAGKALKELIPKKKK